MEQYILPMEQPSKTKRYVVWFLIFVCILLFSLRFFSAPNDMPVNTHVRVSSGESLSTITHDLHDGNYIHSELIFKSLVIFFGGDRKIVPGDYYFDFPVPVWLIAKRIVTGDFNIPQVRLTVWEGMNNREIATLVNKKFPSITQQMFIDKAQNLEGYLFPDTYFVSPFATADDIVKKMNDNFSHRVRTLDADIKNSGHTREEIIVMASLIEKESSGAGDRAIISGILWNRINGGLRLQVDATLAYLLGKESKNLTLLDLKTDSPYNTYVHAGLPPGPIGNPGIESIKAALHPAQTNYMFYLHGTDGVFHGAVIFAEHIKNKNLYLR